MRKFLVRFLTVLLAFQGVVAAQLLTPNLAQAAGPSPTVAISEVMFAGSTASPEDQWLELTNYGSMAVELGGWELSGVTLADLMLPDMAIAPGAKLLVGEANIGTSVATILSTTIDIPVTGFTLNPAVCQPIILQDSTAAIVDQMGCDGTNWLGGAAGLPKRSLERAAGFSDGLNPDSWQSAKGFKNLVSSAYPNNFATAKFNNDATYPNGAAVVVNDGVGADQDFLDSAPTTTLDTNWTATFTDSENGPIVGYSLGLGTTPTTADVVDFTDPFAAPITTTSYQFTGLAGLSQNTKYFVLVKAVDSAGVVSFNPVASDGLLFNNTDPGAPTLSSVTDTANDNGGSVDVTWTAPDVATSPDVTAYEISYQKGVEPAQLLTVGMVTTAKVPGLTNATDYTFSVKAMDAFGHMSVASNSIVGQALDNLVPTLNASKVLLMANKPGVADSISGQPGAVSEAGAMIKVYDANPTLPGASLLQSALAQADGSFPALSLGDNHYASVWLQLSDSNPLNLSTPVAFANDIVSPNAPTLESAVSSCQSQSCRVELHWKDNGPDTASYQVGYKVNGVETRSLVLTTTAVQLDLPVGNLTEFVVYGFDAAGNASPKSNALSVQLTAGVKTTTKFVAGNQETFTEAIPGSREVVTAPAPSDGGLTIVPKVEANNDAAPAPTSDVPVKDANSQDWTRIFIVVILLLIVAGGFYSLSRSFREVPADEPILPIEPAAPTKRRVTPTKRKNSKRRRGR